MAAIIFPDFGIRKDDFCFCPPDPNTVYRTPQVKRTENVEFL